MTSNAGKDDLLIEIGTEELPPKTLSKMMRSFAVSFEQSLTEAQLSFDGHLTGEWCFATSIGFDSI